ncbi:hypothetical protein BDA99DRAFT_516957, partial [Phascolomyces articulosus]
SSMFFLIITTTIIVTQLIKLSLKTLCLIMKENLYHGKYHSNSNNLLIITPFTIMNLLPLPTIPVFIICNNSFIFFI